MKTTLVPEKKLSDTSMKVTKRPADERGKAEHGWLHARFTFSFADYFDPAHMGFRSLRVMNNDTIEPGGGFGTHPHKDAEIFTYVISGQLEHKDSMGNGSIIKPGDMQYMSAGSGVLHSEFNPSSKERTELYQIWLRPNQSGGEPLYSEKKLADWKATHDWIRLFSGDESDESVTRIRQNAEIIFARLESGRNLSIPTTQNRPHSWIQVVKGSIRVAGTELNRADGLAIENHPDSLEITTSENSEVFVFQLS